MQKAIRNASGKPTTVEHLDRRDSARQKPSANPIVVAGHSAQDSAAKAAKAGDGLDRDYEKNRVAQDRREQGPDSQKGDG